MLWLTFVGLSAFQVWRGDGGWSKLRENLIVNVQGWDGHHYLDLAENGYRGSGPTAVRIVFFPLFPMLIRLLAQLPYLDTFWASLLLVSVCAIAARGLFWLVLAQLGLGRRAIARVFALLVLSPLSIYCISIYTEGLFLLLTLAAVSALLAGRPFVGAAIAGLSAASRMPGMLLVVPFGWEWLRRCRDRRQVTVSDLLRLLAQVALILSGYLAYLGLNHVLFGDPFHFRIPLRDNWHKQYQPFWEGIAREARLVGSFPAWSDVHRKLDQLMVLAFPPFLAAYWVRVGRRLVPTGLLLWCYVSWALFASQSFWMSAGRYMFALFPLYLAAEELTRPRRWAYPAVVFAASLLLAYDLWALTAGDWVF